MNHRIIVVAAILGLLTLAAGANDMMFDSKNSLAEGRQADLSAPVESGSPLKKISALPRANSLGYDENSSDSYPSLSCLQLQVIDEVELLGGATHCD